jgi:glyoxylase-like metal-dependent hydrolase (beta-lactamase superfamily II)
MPPQRKPAAKAANKTLKPKAAPAPGKNNYRVRVRMYRQGLGDCFLLTFPRQDKPPFNLLIDCGALNRNKAFMTRVVQHIEESVKNGAGTGRLDLVVATHEHKDHLSGFNQAREIFNRMDIGGVWLGWTENLSIEEAKAIKQAKKTALAKLQAALASPFGSTRPLEGVRSLLDFSASDDTTGTGRVAEALDYLKLRGKPPATSNSSALVASR